MRMTRSARLALLSAALPLAACSSLGGGEYGIGDYNLVRVHRVEVGDGGMTVVAPRPWNERRRSILFDDVPDVEDWTLNGPILDGISFVSGMKSGRYLIRQRKSADQQVPKFRADMTPPEIAAMLESLYRVRGGAVEFRTLNLQPRPFLGAANGFQLFVTSSETKNTITADRPAEMKKPRLIAFMPCSSSERALTDMIPTIDVTTPTARHHSGNITPAIAPTVLPLNAAAPRISDATSVTS